MKAALVILLLGIVCAFCDTPVNTVHPTPGHPVDIPEKVRPLPNRIRITFDGFDNDGWITSTPEFVPLSTLEDSPPGCSFSPVYASNSTKDRQLCSRKASRVPQIAHPQVRTLNERTIEVSVYDRPQSHKAKCKLTWNKFLAGYDLKIYYVLIDNGQSGVIEVTSCEAVATESSVSQDKEIFLESRELILDGTLHFRTTIILLLLMVLSMAMCCACTFFFACLCSKMCRKTSRRPQRSDVENVELEQMPQGKSSEQPVQAPVYIPYYMINPYNAHMFAGQPQQGEQTFVMLNPPQQT